MPLTRFRRLIYPTKVKGINTFITKIIVVERFFKKRSTVMDWPNVIIIYFTCLGIDESRIVKRSYTIIFINNLQLHMLIQISSSKIKLESSRQSYISKSRIKMSKIKRFIHKYLKILIEGKKRLRDFFQKSQIMKNKGTRLIYYNTQGSKLKRRL